MPPQGDQGMNREASYTRLSSLDVEFLLLENVPLQQPSNVRLAKLMPITSRREQALQETNWTL